jgi:hypothetical protein
MNQRKQDDNKKSEQPNRTAWYRKPDLLLAIVIAALLMLSVSWYVNNPNSPGFWRSYR